MSDWKQEWIVGLYSGNAGERAATAREIMRWATCVRTPRLGNGGPTMNCGDCWAINPQVTVGVAVAPEKFAKITRGEWNAAAGRGSGGAGCDGV